MYLNLPEMHITKLVIHSLTIAERATLDTDSLDPELLQLACETLARAHATLSPLQISDDADDPVYLELGWPEGMREIRAEPGAQLVLGQIFADMPEPAGTVFHFLHHGSGPVYIVLPAEQDDEGGAAEEGGTEETDVDDLLSELRLVQPGDLPERVSRFDSMWEEALASLPAVLQFGPADWGEHWDDFALYLAVAILLEE